MIQPFGGKRYEKPCNVMPSTYAVMADYVHVAYTYTRKGTRLLAMATSPGLSPTCASLSCVRKVNFCARKVNFHVRSDMRTFSAKCAPARVPKKSALWCAECCFGSVRMMRFSAHLPLPYIRAYTINFTRVVTVPYLPEYKSHRGTSRTTLKSVWIARFLYYKHSVYKSHLPNISAKISSETATYMLISANTLQCSTHVHVHRVVHMYTYTV